MCPKIDSREENTKVIHSSFDRACLQGQKDTGGWDKSEVTGGGVGGSLRQQKGLDLQYFNILAFICLQIVKTQLKVSSSANDKLHQWWREWWGDREAPVLDCFWNEGSYQDEFGKMPHSCSHSKFVLSLSETQIGSPAHTFIHLSP